MKIDYMKQPKSNVGLETLGLKIPIKPFGI
jgi:hypothetical protein